MIELIEKRLQCSTILYTEQIRSVFESRCLIPDSMPGIHTILSINGINKTSFSQDRGLTPVLNLQHTVLYVSDQDYCIKSYTFTTEHQLDLNLPEKNDDGQFMINAFIEHTDFTLENNREITLRIVVRIEPRFFSNQEKDIVTDLSGLEDLQTKQGLLPITNFNLLPEVVTEIKEDLILPPGKKAMAEILQNDAHITDVTVALEDGLAIVKGKLSICTLYTSESGGAAPEFWENSIPFTCNLILPSTEAQLVFKDCKISDFSAEIKEDEDGECRIMSFSALISVAVVCSEYQEFSIVTDAFSLSKKITFTNEPLKFSRHICSVSDQFVLKDIIQKPEDSPEIQEIINISGAVGHLDYQVGDGKISLDGFISCKVLYLSQDPEKTVSAFNMEIPFSQNLDEPHGEDGLFAALAAEIVHISFAIISPDEIELRLALHVSGALTKTEEFMTITNINEESLPDCHNENKPSILIYIVQPGDTLWEIAKHYGTSPTSLQNLNDIKTPENLMPGQKLIIA